MLAPHAAALTRPGLACAFRRRCRPHWRSAMTVAKVIEVNASSEKSVEDAVRHGLKKTSETVKGIKGVWVNELTAVTNDTGDITEWRVTLRLPFAVGYGDISDAGLGEGAGSSVTLAPRPYPASPRYRQRTPPHSGHPR